MEQYGFEVVNHLVLFTHFINLRRTGLVGKTQSFKILFTLNYEGNQCNLKFLHDREHFSVSGWYAKARSWQEALLGETQIL